MKCKADDNNLKIKSNKWSVNRVRWEVADSK